MGRIFDWFEVTFLEELDSWMSADIMCCSSCYDDFKERWPATASRDLAFQSSYMPMDSFYAGSRLRDLYKEKDFRRLAPFLKCPCCSGSLMGGFWAYNHPFDLPENFHSTTEEIARIARSTPFLLLEHPFARRVLGAIKDLGSKCAPTSLSTAFYRARFVADVTDPVPGAFGPAPAHVVKEGRFNHAGKAMLYLASAIETAFAEVGAPGKELYIAEIHIARAVKILDLLEPEYGDEKVDSLLMAVGRSAMAAAPRQSEGWDRHEYVFTRFIADCAVGAGFDAIRYASTRDTDGHNLVFLSPPIPLESLAEICAINKFNLPPARV